MVLQTADVDGYPNLFTLQGFNGQNEVNILNWTTSHKKT